MYAARDRQIKSLLILVSVLWHCLILYVFFVITRKSSDEPLRITIHPKTAEFLLSRPAQAVPPSTLLPSQPVPHALPQVVPTVIQPAPVAVPEEDEDQDRYKLKNPVSGGTLSVGSLVAGQPGPQAEEKEQDIQESKALVDQGQDSSQQEQQQEDQANQVQDVVAGTAKNGAASESAESVSGQDDVHQETMLEKLESYGGTSFEGGTYKDARSQQSQVQAQRGAQAIPETSRSIHTAKPQAMAPKQTAVKGLTLADITRGFVRNVKHEQTATSRYTYQGAGRGAGVYAPPTSGVAMAEQMYASKIYSLLEQSAMAYSRKIYARQELDMETILEVTIDKTGRILDVVLSPCLAEKDMELALSTIVKSVGLFPPIPKQFKKQKIIVSIPLHIKSQQGFASYRLLYGMRTL